MRRIISFSFSMPRHFQAAMSAAGASAAIRCYADFHCWLSRFHAMPDYAITPRRQLSLRHDFAASMMPPPCLMAGCHA